MKEELNNLEKISQNSLYSAGVSLNMVDYSFNIFKRHIRGKSLLELGPAEGVMTENLVKLGLEMTVVEGSKKFSEDLQKRYPKLEVVNCLFEDFQTEKKFDNIILGHVLEHVIDPVQILKVIKPYLTANGKILAAVPNSRSLHRQAAVIMGLLAQEDAQSELDIHHGHRRVFNPESFRNAFYQAGLKVELFGGYWLKPISNKQIEETWSAEMLDAFMQLGERYPDIAGEIYVVASKKTINQF